MDSSVTSSSGDFANSSYPKQKEEDVCDELRDYVWITDEDANESQGRQRKSVFNCHLCIALFIGAFVLGFAASVVVSVTLRGGYYVMEGHENVTNT